mgnify:CR=1 FL=1
MLAAGTVPKAKHQLTADSVQGVEIITQSKKGMDTFFAAMFLTAILHLYFKMSRAKWPSPATNTRHAP